jgi:hypothetical protein
MVYILFFVKDVHFQFTLYQKVQLLQIGIFLVNFFPVGLYDL